MTHSKPDYHEARKRSIDNLQRLYTVVISLALTVSLTRLLGSLNNLPAATLPQWLMFVSLVSTVVPFYHGANRYLDATYVTNERRAKRGALMVDFVLLFLEGLGFFTLAVVIFKSERFFYTGLALLLLVDIGWVGATKLYSEDLTEKRFSFAKWAMINIFTVAIILVIVWTQTIEYFWRSVNAPPIALSSVMVIRAILDYRIVWDFYYPPEMSAHE